MQTDIVVEMAVLADMKDVNINMPGCSWTKKLSFTAEYVSESQVMDGLKAMLLDYLTVDALVPGSNLADNEGALESARDMLPLIKSTITSDVQAAAKCIFQDYNSKIVTAGVDGFSFQIVLVRV